MGRDAQNGPDLDLAGAHALLDGPPTPTGDAIVEALDRAGFRAERRSLPRETVVFRDAAGGHVGSWLAAVDRALVRERDPLRRAEAGRRDET